MNIEDFRIFLATAKSGSFTAAAEKLLLSKQYVSRRMTSFEARLGVQLLVRNSRKLRVTDVGSEFLIYVERILGNVAEAERFLALRVANTT